MVANKYTAMVKRLVAEGMGLKHAVSLVAGTYGVSTDELYKLMAKED